MGIISEDNLSFLSDLKRNNNREWFNENKDRYLKSQEEVIKLGDRMIELLSKNDEIETANGKKALYRIYRDIRFSKDKTPYKTQRSALFRRRGAERRGTYYLRIAPGGSFIGGGFYRPEKDDLLHLRKQIEVDAEPLRGVLNSRDFKNYYGELLGDKLKTVPRGFSKEDPNIELLRHKSYYVIYRFSDAEILSNSFPEHAAAGYEKIRPFFDVMTDYLTTDLNGVPLF